MELFKIVLHILAGNNSFAEFKLDSPSTGKYYSDYENFLIFTGTSK